MTREEALQEAKQRYLDEVQAIEDEYFWYLPDFPSRIKAYAKRKKVKLAVLEHDCGYAEGYFSRIKKNNSQYKFLMALQTLHKDYGMDLNYLICGEREGGGDYDCK